MIRRRQAMLVVRECGTMESCPMSRSRSCSPGRKGVEKSQTKRRTQLGDSGVSSMWSVAGEARDLMPSATLLPFHPIRAPPGLWLPGWPWLGDTWQDVPIKSKAMLVWRILRSHRISLSLADRLKACGPSTRVQNAYVKKVAAIRASFLSNRCCLLQCTWAT